jgi:hypothetical protein
MEGAGTMTFGISCPSLDSYTGDWKGNKFHGVGTLLYRHEHTPNIQARYFGEFKMGKMDGKGRRTSPHGESYDGDWKQDKRHGHGIQNWTNGHCYEGDWVDDKRHGYGKYTGAQGELVYVGDWEENKYHGHGTCVSKDGVYLGDWADVVREGHGSLTEPDGSRYDGQWKNK